MNEQLRNALDNIFDARVPDMWKRGSWASSSIGFWFSELLDRNRQYATWLNSVSFFLFAHIIDFVRADDVL